MSSLASIHFLIKLQKKKCTLLSECTLKSMYIEERKKRLEGANENNQGQVRFEFRAKTKQTQTHKLTLGACCTC